MHIDPPAQIESQTKDSSDSVQTKSSNHNSHAELAKRHSWWIDPATEEPPAPELNYFFDLSLAKDFNDFKRRIMLALKQMGFSDFSFIHMNAAGEADSLVLTTIPKGISQGYFDQKLYDQAPTIPYSDKGNGTPFQTEPDKHLRQTAFDHVIAGPTNEPYKIDKSKGFYGFYNLPANSFDGTGKVMFQLIQRDGDSTAFREKIAQFMGPLEMLLEAIDMIVIQRFAVTVGLKRPPLEVVYKINPAPLRVLQHLANNDLNLQCLADKLSISVVTANKHMETVRKNLGVRTNYAAIKKALIQGLVTFDE
jgi:DNA-binding CsgD family transcriptional regulator